MVCVGIDRKVSRYRVLRNGDAWSEGIGDLRGACRRKHIAALRREHALLKILAAAPAPMTLAELAEAMHESVTTIYSTVLRLRERRAIESARKNRAHAHTIKRAA